MRGHRSVAVLVLGASGCGGGGGDSGGIGGGGGGGGNGNGTWVLVFSSLPRTSSIVVRRPVLGTDPFDQAAYPDVTGTVTDQNNWLRSWTNELYLWYSEVPDLESLAVSRRQTTSIARRRRR